MANVCGACRQDFGSVAAFDAHRVGVHAYTYSEGANMDPIREDGRRCLAVWEMAANGSGFLRNGRGAWSLARSLEWGRSQRARDCSANS